MFYIKKWHFFTCMIALIILTSVISVGTANPFGFFAYSQLGKLKQTVNVLEAAYYEEIDKNDLAEGAVAGIAAACRDPYTLYMDTKGAASFNKSVEGVFGGIGVNIQEDRSDNTIVVLSPLKDTPAEAAGIAAGDKILKVNGEEVWGNDMDNAVSMITGKPDTSLVLTILKKDSKEPIDIEIIRKEITVSSVEHEMLDNNIAYIKIIKFSSNTASEFFDALQEIQEAGAQKLVLDLRNNPGGEMGVSIAIADMLLPEGVITYTLDKNQSKQTYNSKPNSVDLPLAVLINGWSASASEIVAGAVRDHEAGLLVGETTFGKGLVQSRYQFNDGSQVNLTIARYYTPNGVCIHGDGIKPDIEVTLPDDYVLGNELDPEGDIQLKAAIASFDN